MPRTANKGADVGNEILAEASLKDQHCMVGTIVQIPRADRRPDGVVSFLGWILR